MVAMLSHVALLGLRHRRSARSACVNAGALCLSLYIVALLRVRHCRSAQSASPLQESASCRALCLSLYIVALLGLRLSLCSVCVSCAGICFMSSSKRRREDEENEVEE